MKKILSSKAKIINWVRAQEPKLELAPALFIEKMKKRLVHTWETLKPSTQGDVGFGWYHLAHLVI